MYLRNDVDNLDSSLLNQIFCCLHLHQENCVYNYNKKQCAESIHRGREIIQSFNDQIAENSITSK